MKKRIVTITTLFAVLTIGVAETRDYEMAMGAAAASTTLRISGINSKILVSGTDDAFIRIHVDGFSPVPKQAEGLRSLLSTGSDNTGVGLELKALEGDAKTLLLTQARAHFGNEISIEVPRNMNLDLDAHIMHGIEVKGVGGQVVAKTLNGEITLTEVSGPLVINTVNGPIHAEMKALNQDLPSSITSVNGLVELWFKPEEKASFDLSVMHGEIYTDLDLKTRESDNGMHRLVGNREIHADLNEGGVAFSISTVNGEIYLRKSQ